MSLPQGFLVMGFLDCGGLTPLWKDGGWRPAGQRLWRWRGLLLVCALLANAPDIDYLFGLAAGDLNSRHQLVTHTLGWIAAVALALWWAQRCSRPRAVRMSTALIFLLLASHIWRRITSGRTWLRLSAS